MLGLVVIAQTIQEVVLAVYGKIDGSSIHLFKEEVERHLEITPRLVLDLDQVAFIDGDGLAFLQQWVGPKLSLRGGSPFLRALLGAEGLETN